MKMYQLTQLLRAVHVSGDQIGAIAVLPEGAVLTVIGPASVAGLTEVECEGKHYALFQDDLEHRAKQLLKGRVSRYDDLVS
jgi:hypothetical protein